jgi:hypothetical protein
MVMFDLFIKQKFQSFMVIFWRLFNSIKFNQIIIAINYKFLFNYLYFNQFN